MLSFNVGRDFHYAILYVKYLYLFKETVLNIKHLKSFMYWNVSFYIYFDY